MELGSDLGVELAHCDRISWMAEARKREEQAMLRPSGTGVRSRSSLTCEVESNYPSLLSLPSKCWKRDLYHLFLTVSTK
jgi:hypothetical protein